MLEWIQVYEHLQQLGTAFIYIQIGCGLLGSLARLYSGVPVAELAVSLFALVAIESGSHLLFRIYLLLLAASLLLDVFWFVLVASALRSFVRHYMVSVQGTSSVVRLASAFIWFRVYRQEVSQLDASLYQPVNFDSRLDAVLAEDGAPSPSSSHQPETLAGSIYDPAYYSSLFEETKDGELELIL